MDNYCCEDHFSMTDEDDGYSAIDWGSWGGVVTGPAGPYYTPKVSNDGVLSWTNNGGLPNPASVNLMKGDSYVLYFRSVPVSAATGAEIMRITDGRITANTVVLECVFAAPAYIASGVTWTSYAGYIAFSGTCTASTTANVVLGTKNN